MHVLVLVLFLLQEQYEDLGQREVTHGRPICAPYGENEQKRPDTSLLLQYRRLAKKGKKTCC
jgi:hypothetical protein